MPASSTTAASASRIMPLKGRSAVSPWAESRGCSAAPTAAACGRRRCTRSSAPPSSTISIRRLGSPMFSAASPGRRRASSTNSFRGTGKTTGGTIGLHRPGPPPDASSPAIPRRQTQPKIPRGLPRMHTFDRVGNRYESHGADILLRSVRPRHMVRPSGTEAPGTRRCGQADPHDELRARVSSWPPLRLARLR